MEKNILDALEEKKIFIGYLMLCRFLNGKGYKRYGCNAGYPDNDKSGKARLNPCNILCLGSKIYRSKVRYWCKKLEKKEKLLLETINFYDSKNPNSEVKPHRTDIFTIIALNKKFYDDFIKKHTLQKYL